MRAMRDAPAAAAVLGVDIHVLKVQIFVLSAVLGSLAGSLFAHYVSFVSVDSFGVDRAINFLLLAVLGGVVHRVGTGAGRPVHHVLPQRAEPASATFTRSLFAACLIAAVIFLPEGFGGAHRAAGGAARPAT